MAWLLGSALASGAAGSAAAGAAGAAAAPAAAAAAPAAASGLSGALSAMTPASMGGSGAMWSQIGNLTGLNSMLEGGGPAPAAKGSKRLAAGGASEGQAPTDTLSILMGQQPPALNKTGNTLQSILSRRV